MFLSFEDVNRRTTSVRKGMASIRGMWVEFSQYRVVGNAEKLMAGSIVRPDTEVRQ